MPYISNRISKYLSMEEFIIFSYLYGFDNIRTMVKSIYKRNIDDMTMQFILSSLITLKNLKTKYFMTSNFLTWMGEESHVEE
jgi:hypothetical protein